MGTLFIINVDWLGSSLLIVIHCTVSKKLVSRILICIKNCNLVVLWPIDHCVMQKNPLVQPLLKIVYSMYVQIISKF